MSSKNDVLKTHGSLATYEEYIANDTQKKGQIFVIFSPSTLALLTGQFSWAWTVKLYIRFCCTSQEHGLRISRSSRINKCISSKDALDVLPVLVLAGLSLARRETRARRDQHVRCVLILNQCSCRVVIVVERSAHWQKLCGDA